MCEVTEKLKTSTLPEYIQSVEGMVMKALIYYQILCFLHGYINFDYDNDRLLNVQKYNTVTSNTIRTVQTEEKKRSVYSEKTLCCKGKLNQRHTDLTCLSTQPLSI